MRHLIEKGDIDNYFEKTFCKKCIRKNDGLGVIGCKCTVGEIREALISIKEVDAEPVRHGYWINYKDEHTCSCCGETVTGDWYAQDNDAYWYCPWCGTKLDAEKPISKSEMCKHAQNVCNHNCDWCAWAERKEE